MPVRCFPRDCSEGVIEDGILPGMSPEGQEGDPSHGEMISDGDGGTKEKENWRDVRGALQVECGGVKRMKQ